MAAVQCLRAVATTLLRSILVRPAKPANSLERTVLGERPERTSNLGRVGSANIRSNFCDNKQTLPNIHLVLTRGLL